MSFQFWMLLLSTLGITAVSTFLLTSASGYLRILDHPNERSLHNRPTPRTGGLAILFSTIAGYMLIAFLSGLRYEMSWIVIAALLVGVISFIDDLIQLPVYIRFITHLAAGFLIFSIYGITGLILWPGSETALPVGLAWSFGLLYVVWMTNLYNFMDGMDGFAGGMAVFGFGALGLLGHFAGDDYYASVCWVIAAASAGFLVWNFPPARIFMGDTGSSTLGLLAAALSLWADRDGLFPLWLSIIVFAPFIFDATLTLVRRTLQGKRVWEAHRSHYYQRLVQAGWSHRRTVLWEYGLMLLCGSGALYAFRAPVAAQWLIIGIVLSTCVAAVIGVRHVERRRPAPTPNASL